MSKYTVVVKRGDFQYSVSSGNKEFVVSHIQMLFSELKMRSNTVSEPALSQLAVEKPAEEKKETIETSPQNPIQTEPEIPAIAFTENVFQPKNIEENDISENISEPDVQEQPSNDFENILEEKINNPAFIEETGYEENPADYETIIKTISSGSLTDYLIITAYFMLENEGIEKFALKQLNQKLFSSMKLLVDNKTAQKAVEAGLIEVVSDFSQTEVTEYSITQQGRDYYINGFQ